MEDARTIGARLRRIRNARKMSLRVIAGLAGMSKSRLSEIERGESALDSISEIVALANALQIAPSELIRLPVPAPANGETDSAVEAVRSAVTAVGRSRPGGLVLPVTVLRDRVSATLNAHYGCQPEGVVGAALPALSTCWRLTDSLARGSAGPTWLSAGRRCPRRPHAVPRIATAPCTARSASA